MEKIKEHYFKNDTEFRSWLHINHSQREGIYLIFYSVGHQNDSMRWEEAVKVALCYGWIDSTVKSLGDGKRRQYFCRRKPKSVWSKVNKKYIEDLQSKEMMHESGIKAVEIAKENGSWIALDDVEEGIVPLDLKRVFDQNSTAYTNFQNFTRGQRKSYLYYLNQAQREATRQKRIAEIILCCEQNIKSRTTR
ncbi:MAG: YdeI family protein [Flavobacteriaceae bacterium]